jgi:three-Cys-motif partner protein
LKSGILQHTPKKLAMSAKFNPILPVDDDGLTIPEVGAWADTKYKLLGGYCEIFTTGMKNLWDNLVYIDLFAGAGYAKIKETPKIRMTSALIALSVTHKFNKYIFCEKDEANFLALKERVKRHFPDMIDKIEFIQGDSNENIKTIIEAIPKHSIKEKVLRFCFVDPFSLNLKFSTIQQLSAVGKIDFLILLALYMDANRNLIYYINDKSKKVEEFIDDPNWRIPFVKGIISTNDFIKYLAEKYDSNMKKLEYKEPAKKHQVKIGGINVPLYYLAFYSKHERGNDFYQKVEKYLSSQQSLF